MALELFGGKKKKKKDDNMIEEVAGATLTLAVTKAGVDIIKKL